MDLLTALGILASVVTILTFVYMIIFGQRALLDWWQRRKRGKRAGSRSGPSKRSTVSAPSVPSSLREMCTPVLPSAPLPDKTQRDMPPDTEAVTVSRTIQEFIESIAQVIENRSCVFFLGAGVSIEAGMPGGSELAEMLARRAGWEYHDEPLQQAAQRYATLIGPVRPVLQDLLRRRLADARVSPTDAHRALVCMADKLDVILTTNWDNLLEDAFDASRTARDCQRVYRDAHVPTLQPAKTNIVKFHGHIDDHNSYVVTRDDRQVFQERNPRLADYVRLCLTTSTLVIVGYRHEDEDFRDIYEGVLRSRRPGEEQRPVYVVNPQEDIVWEQYWRDKANQRFIPMSATDFLTRVYREVRNIANRDKELEIGRDLFPSPYGRPVIEFCGLPGIGKSTLLTSIRNELEKSGVYTAAVDFSSPDFCEDSRAGHRLVWDEIVRQLGVRASYENKEDLREQLRRRRRVVLFFDTVDQAPAGTVCWLGDTFATLMDELPDLRAIFACRSARLSGEWQQFRLKQKVATRRLTPFERPEDTVHQMEMELFFNEALAHLVFGLTKGHPGMVQHVVDWLRERDVKNSSDLDQAAHAELCQFVDELLDIYILGDVDADLKPVIRQLAHYRQFSWRELSPILGRPVLECDAFMRERLWPTGLLERDRGLFRIDGTARELLLNIALLRDTDRFIATSAEIGRQYDELAAGFTDNWHLYVVEHLYHLINELQGRRQAGENVDVTAVLLSALSEQLQKATDEENIMQLRDSLRDDSELEALAERVHPDLYSTMLQAVEERQMGSEEMTS